MNQYSLFTICFAAGVLLFAIGLLGSMDYRAAQAEQAHYCQMVSIGAWPNYQGACK